MSKTTIEWTDRTLSIARGCDAVSPGCLNCYAARMAARFARPGEPFDGLAVLKDQPPARNGSKRGKLAVWTDKPVMLVPDAMLEALSLRKPCKVFVCSMSDLFHDDVPFEYIAVWWAFMAASPHITYQIVTKRAARMARFFEWLRERGGLPGHREAIEAYIADRIPSGPRGWFTAHPKIRHRLMGAVPEVLPNVWLLVSAENQATLDERVPHLLACPAVVRGISAEPLLEFLNLRPHFEGLDWVIVGGESGPGARPFELEWARSIRRQLREGARLGLTKAALFLKQLGSCAMDAENGIAGRDLKVPSDIVDLSKVRRLKDSHGGDEAEWPADLQGLRAFPVSR